MADNTPLNAGTGGDVLATDDLATLNGGASSGVKVQRNKIGFGADGDFRDVDATHGLPVAPLAGESHLGAVGGNSVVVGGTFNRPADTTAYAIGDLVANSTTAGSVTPIPCAVARVNQGTGVIRRIRLSIGNTGFAGTEVFRVHLFRTAPTVANGDNGAFSANGIAAVALGYTDVTMSHLYNDGAKGFTATDIVFDAASASQTIYALIEARVAFTPASGTLYTLALEVLQD